MMLSLFTIAVLLCDGHARIVEQSDHPKVDPLTLDVILSQIVENSMDDMRFRLRQAIYSMTLKTAPRFTSPDSGVIDNYEEWLMEQFIAQIIGNSVNETIASETIASAEENHRPKTPLSMIRGARLHEQVADDEHDSHKMSIALETYTNEPLKEHSGKLITADDLRMFDSPPPQNVNQADKRHGYPPQSVATSLPLEASFFLFHLSLWQLLIVVIPSVTFLILIALTLVAWFRVRRRKTAFLKRMPDPFMISGMHTLPDTSNTPQSFLDRLNQLQQVGTVVRERDHCEVWTNPQRAPSSLGSVVRS